MKSLKNQAVRRPTTETNMLRIAKKHLLSAISTNKIALGAEILLD